jgi:hypothetical protein
MDKKQTNIDNEKEKALVDLTLENRKPETK